MAKPNKYEICKTDIKNVIFELEKADAVYSTIKTLSASNRRYAIYKLLTKTQNKTQMNKNMLAKEVAVSEKVTLFTACKTVDGVLRVIAETLAKGESVKLRGFGAFTVVNKPERILKNIRTGKPVTIPAHKSVRFKLSKEIVTKLNK